MRLRQTSSPVIERLPQNGYRSTPRRTGRSRNAVAPGPRLSGGRARPEAGSETTARDHWAARMAGEPTRHRALYDLKRHLAPCEPKGW
jgi:hypothetical protein